MRAGSDPLGPVGWRRDVVEGTSQIALPRLAAEGMSADAAFVDGSHVFHNVFVDLYFLQMIVRPGGLLFSTIIGARGRYGRLAISRPIWVGGRMRL